MLKLNKNRNIEFRMELCSVNPHATEDNGMFLFSVGVQVVDGTADGYAGIHYSETLRKQFPIDLNQVGKKMYGDYEFYSDNDLAIKGIEIINKNFEIQLV